MELELIRSYYTNGTNGMLYINNMLQCFTIELPWMNNHPRISCIPEGTYTLKKRYSPKFKQHLLVQGVEGRDVILIHPANDALKELKGCIAPVSILTGEGTGSQSRIALEKLRIPVFKSLEKKETVLLTIKLKII
ncbi:MAG: DUF5675 family protein [Bacteroidota bacterium]|nr:DUF5675 family protein [Bacteroidota bacterium]